MVSIVVKEKKCSGFKVCLISDTGVEIGRAFLYTLFNDLHSKPFGFVEDVFIEKEFRGSGLSKDIVAKLKEVAKENGCYKIIFTSRYGKDRLHDYYEKQGFIKSGFSFRMDLE